MANPARVHREFQEVLDRYIDTQYWLRHPKLMKERRKILQEPGYLFTDYFLEPVIPYDSTEPLDEVIEDADLDPEAMNIVAEALFGDFARPPGEQIKLRQHQADALKKSLQPGLAPQRNVVVTSGTGSGKTE